MRDVVLRGRGGRRLVFRGGTAARGGSGSRQPADPRWPRLRGPIDYDLLLVVPGDAPPARRGSRLAYEALRGTGAAADVLVCTRTYFEERLHVQASLPATVVREGVLLHAA